MLRKAMAAAAFIAAGIIAGCGSGGGTTAPTVSGVAATGAPMSGTAYLKDSAGNPEMSTSINPQTGAFAFNVSGKTPPFLVRAGSLYSMSGGPGMANINPLSNLMVANMAGFGSLILDPLHPSRLAAFSVPGVPVGRPDTPSGTRFASAP